MNLRIPLAKPELTEVDRKAVMDVLKTPYLSSGPKVAEFERAMCDYTGAAHAVAVNSGTSALQLAIRALGIERGAEVVVPSYTFSALLNAILLEGLRPRFVDLDACSYNCSAESMLRVITPETRLIMVVHTFGFPVDGIKIVEDVRRTAGGKRIHVIEDACEALGAEANGRKAGTVADAGLFAFYPNKQITTGEGGMLVTSDENLAQRAARLRNQGRDPALGWNSQAEVGFSYRISDINCALGISQLARIEAVIQKRQMLAETYHGALAGISRLIGRRDPLISDGSAGSFIRFNSGQSLTRKTATESAKQCSRGESRREGISRHCTASRPCEAWRRPYSQERRSLPSETPLRHGKLGRCRIRNLWPIA